MRSVPKPSVTQCPKCQEPKLPHRICGHCGFYGENKLLDVETSKEA